MRRFAQFAVIDWSGAAVARPAGLAIAATQDAMSAPFLLRPKGGWSRQLVCDWLLKLAEAKSDILVGLDLSPALPFIDRDAYFPGWKRSPPDARALWRLVDDISATDEHLSSSSFVRHAEAARHFRHHDGTGDMFEPGRGRLRVCEHGQNRMGLAPQSCFNLVGAAQVGKSSLTGMRVLHRLRGAIPVWPLDPIPAKGPAIVEIYTSLAARAAGMAKGRSKVRDAGILNELLRSLGSAAHSPLAKYDDHSTDAILTAAWLRNASGQADHWQPRDLTPLIAQTEGWTFGVV